jgi:hypothetical protein
LPWAQLGQTYSIELVQLFTSKHDGDPNSIPPYGSYQGSHQSCGTGLDLDVGSMLSMTAVSNDGTVAGYCICHYIHAHADVDGVIVVSPADASALAPPMFKDYEEVVIGNGCHATYEIGIAPANQNLNARSDEWLATDYVLFRAIIFKGDPAACVRPDSQLATDPSLGRCWDTWAVRIRDASGHLLTHDSAPKPGAGLRQDAAVEEDGGE